MNGLDLMLILVVIGTTLHVFYFKKNYGSIGLVMAISTLVVGVHICFAQIRWQIILLYAHPIYMIIYYFLQKKGPNKFKDNLIKGYKNILIVIIIGSCGFAIILPVKELAAPIGQYVVGTKIFNISDGSRKEIYGDQVGEDRDIRVQVWYPSDSHNNKTPEKWMIDGHDVTTEYAKQFHLLGFMLGHTENIYSHSYKNLEISKADSTYPVVILSHGWTSSKNFHLDISERLASNGFIVVGIDHTYGAAATKLENGSVAVLDDNALPVGQDRFIEKAELLVDVYAEDIKFVMDYLAIMNTKDFILKGKINLGQIGTLGHSTGAGAGVQAAIEDERIVAVMGMDPWVEPIAPILLEKGLRADAMFFRSEEWAQVPNNEHMQILFDHSKKLEGVFQIKGSKHIDFTMLYAYSDLTKYLGLAGKNAGYENSLIQQAFALNFFNCYLKDQKNNLENYIKIYKNVEYIEIIKRPNLGFAPKIGRFFRFL